MRVLREAFLALMATALAISGLVGVGVTAKSIYDIEMDINYAAAARQQLAKQYAQVEEKLDAALRENDIVAAAEYEIMLDVITLIDRRVNIIAINDQVQQAKDAFLEDSWNKFVAEQVIGVTGWGFGRIGFGEVTDAYIKGRNWPPRSNFVTFNPVTSQNVRIILGSRPELTVVIFRDNITDFGNMILETVDQMRSEQEKNSGLMSAYDAQQYINAQLEKFEGIRPLPPDIGAYIAASMIRKGQKESAHISDQAELSDFARDWACKRLTELALEQSTNSPSGMERSEALWAAVDMLCGSSSGSDSEEVQGQTEVSVKEESEQPAQEAGAGSYDGLYLGALTSASQDDTNTKILSSSVNLEVKGDMVSVTIDYTVSYNAFIGRDCTATLTQSYKGEGTFNKELSVDLVCQSYSLSTAGGECGSYKESFDRDSPVGRSSKLKGSFIDATHFEGSFLNLEMSLAK